MLAALAPLAVLALATLRVARARALLGLPPSGGRRDVLTPIAVAATIALLAVAATQPALAHRTRLRTRTDAQALFVIDVSGSMQASSGPRSPTRLERARNVAALLRASIPQVPSGIATLTDQLLPVLLPVPDQGAFGATLTHSVAIEQPPPFEDSVVATDFGTLAQVAQYGYFTPHVRRRVLVLLTDGESNPFSDQAVADALARSPATRFIAVQFWRSGERIYDLPHGRPDPGYRPSPLGRVELDGLATATGGHVFGESDIGAAISALHSDLGSSGPTIEAEQSRRNEPLTPYVALSAIVPLALLLWRRNI